MVAHRDLSGAQVHEPKGISTATAGQTYVANGSGSGAWTIPTVLAYGGMCLNDGDGSNTLGTIGTTAKKLAIFTANMPSSGVTPDHTTDDDITVTSAGDYLVTFTATVAVSAAGDAGTYQFRLRIGGSEPSSPKNLGVRCSLAAETLHANISFSGVVTLSASNVLTVWVESDEAGNTDDIIVYDSQFYVEQKV